MILSSATRKTQIHFQQINMFHDAFDYNDNNDNGNDGLWSIIGKWPPPPPPPDVCLTLNPLLVTWHLPIVKNTLIMIITQILTIL